MNELEETAPTNPPPSYYDLGLDYSVPEVQLVEPTRINVYFCYVCDKPFHQNEQPHRSGNVGLHSWCYEVYVK